MSHHNDPGALTAPRRNNYYFGKLMDVAHFQMEQSYTDNTRRLLNRLTLGEGVLCGLLVESENDHVCIMPGVAIDALGRMIMVPAKTCVDPWVITDECGTTLEKLPKEEHHEVHLCLAYRECATDFAPVLVSDCNAKEQCAAGTIVESFRVLVRKGPPEPGNESDICEALLPAKGSPGAAALCAKLSASCAEAPVCPCVVLCTVDLLAGGTIGELDLCSHRPVVYSNARLLEFILCLATRIQEISNE